MARRSIATDAEPAAAADADVQPAARPRIDTAALSIEALAAAILARGVRPRVGEVRRLAEEVVRKKQKKAAKKARKEDRKESRKLSKIPAPKGKK